ncbi:hypothetical protein I547_4472 [Mycobacterium kansasii 824]|nr:hypothetical protein I547_4472 [Mycobacterium kansasii 824]
MAASAADALAGIAVPVPLPPGAGPLPAFGGSVGGGAGLAPAAAGCPRWLPG